MCLFGSRVFPEKKGGDIDLYIETQKEDPVQAYRQKRDFIVELYIQISEQKIDVVLNLLSSNMDLEIYKIVLEEGIMLV